NGTGGSILAAGDGSVGIRSVTTGGITTAFKPFLPAKSADITVLFGVGAGVDYAAAISQYVDPDGAGAVSGINFLNDIAGQLGQTPSQAWATFQGLSATRQQLLVDHAFVDFLSQVALDYHNSSSPFFMQYGRAYSAIDTLFPAR